MTNQYSMLGRLHCPRSYSSTASEGRSVAAHRFEQANGCAVLELWHNDTMVWQQFNIGADEADELGYAFVNDVVHHWH